jgi:hypothetical protein
MFGGSNLFRELPQMKRMVHSNKIADLFCGAGGFSLGAHSAKFQTALAVDIDAKLTSTFKKNFPNASLHHADISKLGAAEITKLAWANLHRGEILGCGCKHRRVGRDNPAYRHGGTTIHRSEYNTWNAMQQRCRDENCPAYEAYGGRGITVCARWREPNGQGFRNFLADMGPRPKGKSLDIENVLGNYEPGNCRWADATTQAQNRRCMYSPEELAMLQVKADEMAELEPY